MPVMLLALLVTDINVLQVHLVLHFTLFCILRCISLCFAFRFAKCTCIKCTPSRKHFLFSVGVSVFHFVKNKTLSKTLTLRRHIVFFLLLVFLTLSKTKERVFRVFGFFSLFFFSKEKKTKEKNNRKKRIRKKHFLFRHFFFRKNEREKDQEQHEKVF